MTMTINGSGTITGLTAGGLPDGSVVQVDLAAGVVGNGPCFSAYGTALQSATTGVPLKIAFNTEEFDLTAAYDAATNYRFLPLVAGYYKISAEILAAGASLGVAQVLLYKNGSLARGGTACLNSAANGLIMSVDGLVYLNGTTDYVEAFGVQTSGGALNIGTNSISYQFSGFLARSA